MRHSATATKLSVVLSAADADAAAVPAASDATNAARQLTMPKCLQLYLPTVLHCDRFFTSTMPIGMPAIVPTIMFSAR
jgi:hypothetical protein